MNPTTLMKVDPDSRSNELIQLVSFMLDNEEYGVEVLKVREIIRMPSITRMPNTPYYAEGIINLRGTVVPIVSMRKHFNLSETVCDSRTRIMVMEAPGGLTGLIVDGVSEVIRVPDSDIQPAPSITTGNVGQDCVAGVINHADRLLIVMDIDRMFTHVEIDSFGTV